MLSLSPSLSLSLSLTLSMNMDNLCLVFAPGMVRTTNEDPQALLAYSNKQKMFLKNLFTLWQ
jgi:hypothetical protein